MPDAAAGKSIRATFDNPAAPHPRDRQYYELWGSRRIWHDGWKAVGVHKPGSDSKRIGGKLYRLAEDFSESADVAAKYPEKLEEQLWWPEAARNGALPLLEAPAGRRQSNADRKRAYFLAIAMWALAKSREPFAALPRLSAK